MPLIPQQDVLVIVGPYHLTKGQSTQQAAADELRRVLDSYPPCRIVSLTGGGTLHSYALTAVIETV